MLIKWFALIQIPLQLLQHSHFTKGPSVIVDCQQQKEGFRDGA
jgi:hypothetical protein